MSETPYHPDPTDPPGVQWQLSELRSITEKGFAKLDGRVERIEGEQASHATRLTTVEVKQEIAAKTLEKAAEKAFLDPNKVLLAIVGMLVAWIAGGAPGLPGGS